MSLLRMSILVGSPPLELQRANLSFRVDEKRIETAENDTKTWNDVPSEDIIKSAGRRFGQNKLHLGTSVDRE